MQCAGVLRHNQPGSTMQTPFDCHTPMAGKAHLSCVIQTPTLQDCQLVK